jgi:hypothetical protein
MVEDGRPDEREPIPFHRVESLLVFAKQGGGVG